MVKIRRTTERSFGRWMNWFAASVLLTGATALMADDLQIHLVDIPYVEALWSMSAHADTTAEAFMHWDEDNPPAVPVGCAKCHSTPGYQDFLGADGSAAGVVDTPAPIGTVIDCTACHNAATEALSSVTFPSGVEVKNLGAEASCMVCHQGRESKVSVDKVITDAGLVDPNEQDTADKALSFKNIHYKAAAATLYGGITKGGYQYDGKSYDVKFTHVQGLDTCIDCHDQHSLDVRIEVCADCHAGIQNAEDLRNVRMAGSAPDCDGDGDVLEGIAGEIETLQAALYAAMQAYATKAGVPIVYDSHSHPYFFIDTNGDGKADPNEAKSANKYTPWTPRLLKAAFNYQVSQKENCAFAHNAKYMIQLLFDACTECHETHTGELKMQG